MQVIPKKIRKFAVALLLGLGQGCPEGGCPMLGSGLSCASKRGDLCLVAGRKEWLNILLMCIFNIIGLAGIWIYQYSGLIADGVVRLDSSRVMLSWPLFINLCLCTVISRMFYRKTGKVYMGALINTILFTVISCANTMTLVCTNWWF